jgi:hypothetical protein
MDSAWFLLLKWEGHCITTGEWGEYSVSQTMHVFSDSNNVQLIGTYGLVMHFASDIETAIVRPVWNVCSFQFIKVGLV